MMRPGTRLMSRHGGAREALYDILRRHCRYGGDQVVRRLACRLRDDRTADRMTAARPLPDAAESDVVAAFLRAHPAWLAEHPELYRLLAPPRRVHGEPLTDHMAAMLRAERAHASELIDAGRAAAGMAGRVQEGVLALMRAADPAECVSGELPGLLGIDAAALCAEAQHAVWHKLPPGTVRRLLDGRDV